MSALDSTASIRFYFSFRSPYAWRLGIERDGIFGVPSFVYAGKLYLGAGPYALSTRCG